LEEISKNRSPTDAILKTPRQPGASTALFVKTAETRISIDCLARVHRQNFTNTIFLCGHLKLSEFIFESELTSFDILSLKSEADPSPTELATPGRLTGWFSEYVETIRCFPYVVVENKLLCVSIIASNAWLQCLERKEVQANRAVDEVSSFWCWIVIRSVVCIVNPKARCCNDKRGALCPIAVHYYAVFTPDFVIDKN
jgi:hypothetical protein